MASNEEKKKPDIRVEGDWVKATIGRDIYCPDCGSILIIGAIGYTILAFCPECKCYFVNRKDKEKYEGEIK